MLSRTPPPPMRRGERLLEGLNQSVRSLSRPQTLNVDDQGRFLLGGVFFIFTTNDDGSITVQLQNATTLGPKLAIGVLT